MKILAISLVVVSQAVFAQSPNVIIIYADDMGYGDLKANCPDSKIPTPNLDQLAADGMRFTDGHSSSGVCTPSRFALLTGQHHWRKFHGICGPFGGPKFKSEKFTLPRMFKSKGYATAMFGKWHLGWDWRGYRKSDVPNFSLERPGRPEDFDWSQPIPAGPVSIGFDTYFGDGTINFPPYSWIENDRVTTVPTQMLDLKPFGEPPEGPWGSRMGPMSTDWNPYEVLPKTTERAVEWINAQSDDQPFFVYLAFPSPHVPVIPNKEYIGKSDAGPYGDFMFETDLMVGKVLRALEEKGLSENTLVVFSSDNGAEHLAQPRLETTGHWSSGPLRGIKRDLFEGGHRVPFLVRWPGVVECGTVCEETVSQIDLASTFAEIIGYELTPEEAVDSYNLMPLLKGEPVKSPFRKATIQNTYAGKFAIRQGDWMYIDTASGSAKKQPTSLATLQGYKTSTPGLLYNLKDDLSQHTNLYSSYPEKVAEMKAQLDRCRAGEPCAPHAQFSE